MANMMSTPQTSAPTLASVTSAPPPPSDKPTYVATKALDANGREIEVYSSRNPNTPDGFPTGTDWRRQADLAGVDRYVQNLQGTSGKSDTQTQGASYLIAGSPSTIATGGVKTPSVRGNFTELLATADRGSVYPGEDSAHGSTAMRANKFVAQPKPVARKGSDPLASLIERESADFIQGRTRR